MHLVKLQIAKCVICENRQISCPKLEVYRKCHKCGMKCTITEQDSVFHLDYELPNVVKNAKVMIAAGCTADEIQIEIGS